MKNRDTGQMVREKGSVGKVLGPFVVCCSICDCGSSVLLDLNTICMLMYKMSSIFEYNLLIRKTDFGVINPKSEFLL